MIKDIDYDLEKALEETNIVERSMKIADVFIKEDISLFHQYVEKSEQYRNTHGSLKSIINAQGYDDYMRWRDAVIVREVCKDNGLFPYVFR